MIYGPANPFDDDNIDQVLTNYEEMWYSSKYWIDAKLPYLPSVQAVHTLALQNFLISYCAKEDDGVIKYLYLGVKTPNLFSRETVISQNFMFYVAKEYRHKAKALLRFVKKLELHIKDQGVDMYSITLPANEQVTAKYKFFSKMGFIAPDLTFIRRC